MAMASSATCRACARAATFTAKVNDSSAAAAEPRLEVRSASPTWCAERRTSSDGLYCRTSGPGACSAAGVPVAVPGLSAPQTLPHAQGPRPLP